MELSELLTMDMLMLTVIPGAFVLMVLVLWFKRSGPKVPVYRDRRYNADDTNQNGQFDEINIPDDNTQFGNAHSLEDLDDPLFAKTERRYPAATSAMSTASATSAVSATKNTTWQQDDDIPDMPNAYRSSSRGYNHHNADLDASSDSDILDTSDHSMRADASRSGLNGSGALNNSALNNEQSVSEIPETQSEYRVTQRFGRHRAPGADTPNADSPNAFVQSGTSQDTMQNDEIGTKDRNEKGKSRGFFGLRKRKAKKKKFDQTNYESASPTSAEMGMTDNPADGYQYEGENNDAQHNQITSEGSSMDEISISNPPQDQYSGSDTSLNLNSAKPFSVSDSTLDTASGTASNSDVVPSGDQLMLVLNVIADGRMLRGPAVLKAIISTGMAYGSMGIFHFYGEIGQHQGRDPLFCLANMMEPGRFDLTTMDELATPGLSLFAAVSQPTEGIETFNTMLGVANKLAETLDATVCDERRGTLNKQSVEHIYSQIQEFRRKMHRNQAQHAHA